MPTNKLTKTLSVFFLLTILLLNVNIVSAFEFDDVKHYDPISRTVTINNCNFWAIICLIEGDVKTTAILESPLNVKVARGEDQLVGWFNYQTTEEDVKGSFGDLYLENKKNGNAISRGKQYKVRVPKEEIIDDYDWVNCRNIKTINGTKEVCDWKETGSHIEKGFEWIPILNPNIILNPNTLYKIGIFVDVEEGDHGEWIPTFSGKQVPEWASWTEDLNTNIVSYYKLDETSGTIAIDSLDVKNGTNSDVAVNKQGIIGTGYYFDGSSSYVDMVESPNQVSTIFSQSVWFNDSGTANGVILIFRGTSGETLQIYIESGTLKSWSGGAGTTITSGIQNNVWYHLVQVYNGTGMNVYLNGTSIKNITVAVNVSGATTYKLGWWTGQVFEGNLDEYGLWNRVLTHSEIIDLYNGGVGITWMDSFDKSPNITLNSPLSANYTSPQNLNINFTASDDIALSDVKLYVNDILNQTNASGINNTDYIFDLNLGEGDYTIYGKATDNNSATTNSTSIRIVINTTPFIEFVSPTYANGTNLSTSYIPINVTLTETYFDNVTFYFYKGGVLNESITFTDSTRFYNKTVCTCDYWEINATVWTTTGQSNSTETRFYTIDLLAPNISIANNLTDLTPYSLPTNSIWNYTVTDEHPDKCYYNTSENSTYTIITCNSSITTTWTTEGNKTIRYCANDTFGHETCRTDYIFVYYIQDNQTDSPDPITEGFDATFTLTVNLTNIPTTTADLIFNGVTYAGISTSSTNAYEFTKTINIPDTFGNTTGINIDWNWSYNITGVITDHSTNTETITVYELGIDNCSSYGDLILNISLEDEKLATLVNETNGANVEIDLTLTSKENTSVTLSYSNTWTNENNPQVCIPSNILNSSEYTIDFTIGFDSTDRVWEFFYLDGGTLNSTKVFDDYTNSTINLMDLETADSTSFLFNYFDVDSLAVDGAMIHVFRKYIGQGEFLEVERSKSDQNGDTIVHLVEEDVIYYFVITDNGNTLHTTSTNTILCQEVPCTIQIEASGISADFDTDWDLIDGGSFSISSNANTRKVTLTYSKNVSADWNLSLYKYDSDGSSTLLNSTTATGTSGTTSLTVPLSAGNVSFFTTVSVDDVYIKSGWVDFEDNAGDTFGTTLSLFLAGLIILSLGLMAVTEGAGVMIWVMLGIFLSGALGLLTTNLNTGISILTYLIVAGALLIWKIAGGRK